MTHGEPRIVDAAKVIGGFLADADTTISREAAWLITDRGLSAANAALASGKVTATDTMTTLRRLNASFRQGGKENAAMLASFGSAQGNPSLVPGSAITQQERTALQAEAIRLLSRWNSLPARDHVTGLFRPISTGSGRFLAGDAVENLGALVGGLARCMTPVDFEIIEAARALGAKDTGTTEVLAQVAASTGHPPKVRIAALRTLAGSNAPQLAEALKKAITDSNSTVRITAAGLLGKTDPAAAAKGLEYALGQGTPVDARAALVELAALPDPEADRILTEQLAALAAGKVPPIAKLELLEAAGKREAPAVKEALAKYEAALPKDDLLARFAACLEGGDVASGRRIFNEHAVAACRRCHMVEKSGGEAGPALDGIATKKDAKYLLESIIAPNAQIAESFRMVVLTMKDGSVKLGVLRAETPESMTIHAPGEEPETVKTADIASRDAVPSSMLPNLGDMLTKREIRDIMAYMATLK